MMHKSQKYFVVGIFVFLIAVSAFLVITWFAVPKKDDEHITYLMYFDTAVTGLSVGSPILLKGIPVGRVQNIEFASFTDDRVKITARIINTAPILQDTKASLKMQGLTGIAYIHLENKIKNSPVLVKKPDQEYMMIQTTSSRIDQLFNELPILVHELTDMGKRLNQLMDKETLEKLSGKTQSKQQSE